ncbi:MAG: ROK family protein [Marinoscillum sp.]|uniref:ROK family protein n=1 Tax=Marinoscillum sp. TaxID=2024838 RepID=UPI0032F180EB
MTDESLWGMDMGGTKIEGVVLDNARDRNVLFRERVPTGSHNGYRHVLSQIDKLYQLMVAHIGHTPSKLGIGTPGTLTRKGLMKNCNATVMNGMPVKKDLEALLGIELIMANDANCFALAETKMGVVNTEYPDAKVVFGVILGTGVGGGVVVNGQVINGHHGIGGEWGHNQLPGFQGRECFCGKSGDNESILSGPSLEWYYESRTGFKKPLKEIVHDARMGTDQVAVDTLRRLVQGFGKAVSVVINILDPDVIVIGGGVGNVDELYTEGKAAIAQHVFNNEFNAPVLKPSLGDSAGVFGAALLVNN